MEDNKEIKQTTPKFKEKVRDMVFDYLRTEYNYDIYDVHTGNGYFLFDFGKNSVTHFKIRQCGKHWQFGLWITDDTKQVTDEGTGKTEYKHTGCVNVQLFGEHEHYIDKFKPVATAITDCDYKMQEKFCNTVRYSKDEHAIHDICWDICWKFTTHISRIMSSKMFARAYYYFNPYGKMNLLEWYVNAFWFYSVRKPVTDLWERKGLNIYLKFVKFVYKLRFGNNIDIDIKYDPEFSPMYNFNINYENCISNSDKVRYIYDKINRRNERTFNKTGYWLMNSCTLFNQVYINNYENENDKRGFYYND